MKYETFCVGELEANVYLLYDDTAAVVIDAGGGSEIIGKRAQALGVKIGAVLLTHGHIDHILEAEAYRAAGIPVGISQTDEPMLSAHGGNLAAYLGYAFDGTRADFTFHGGERFVFGTMQIDVLSTPGHTAGSCCFLCDNVCFSGDTLFLESVGRTDLPSGDHGELIRSITEKLMSLPSDTVVCPGHDEATTVGHERERNPYLTEGIC